MGESSDKLIGKGKIIECNVWCVADDKAKDLGLPEGDEWMPIAIDFSRITMIKLCGENDFIGNDKPTIYIDGQHLTIDIPYNLAVSIWRRSL